MPEDRSHLLTEKPHPASADLDRLTVAEILALMNAEDGRAVVAVGKVLQDVARAVELVVASFREEGRLIYVGAGTSGRLGVLDAAECPPTFSTRPERVIGLVAGGPAALQRAQEGAEDRAEEGQRSISELGVGPRDTVVAIATGGTTPYVLAALEEAIGRGARTVFLCCVENPPLPGPVDVVIAPLVGPEILTGSTRLKAGTATKLILNMLTTAAMVRMGKVYGNLMVDLQVTAEKLEDRGRRILRDLLKVGYEEAGELLRSAGGSVKVALVMGSRKVPKAEAEKLLAQAGGFVRPILEG